MKPIRTVLAMLLLAAAPGAAQADYYYEYETLEGTLSFTDELRRVPEKYRKAAERFPARPLFDYDRTTIVKEGASTASAATIFSTQDSGIERKIDWSASSRGPATPSVQLDLGYGVRLDVSDASDPVHIDRKVRTGDLDNNEVDVDSERTVIRQGDRDLVYID